MSNFYELQELDLSSNKIKDIQIIQKLTNLRSLNLSNNHINLFSSQILEALFKLYSLNIEENPVENIPKENFTTLNRNSISNIHGYFNSLKKGEQRNNEVKLIIVGNTTSGKTSLVKFLQHRKFEEKQSSTHGIELNRWEAPNTSPTLKVNIWDFGGQEYYHATHRLFLDDHAVYLLVWNVDTNEQKSKSTDIYINGEKQKLFLEHFPYSYWLDNIRYYAPNSKVLIVQSKTDVQKIKLIPDDYFASPYNLQVPSYSLSIKEASKNILKTDNEYWLDYHTFENKLIKYLQEDATKYSIGINWIKIRDAIREFTNAKLWMTYSEFELFCRKIDPTIEMISLVRYLSGAASTILYYESDVKLRNIVFLNPQWVIDVIYDILDYTVQSNNGEFTRDHVEDVLQKKDIAPLTDSFIELMKKDRFELIFEKPMSKDVYIAPQYLPETFNDQKILNQLRPESYICFTLHFPHFIPKSIFIKFMVYNGKLSDDVYWKYGIVLGKSNDRIIVECDFGNRLIEVQIADNSHAKSSAHKMFDTLWQLSSKKPDIEVSIDRINYVTISKLEKYLQNSVNSEIESVQGNMVSINDFAHLFGREKLKERKKEATEEPVTILKEMRNQQKIIKVFLASSHELLNDREQFEIFINRENKEYIKQNIFLELNIWEDFIDAVSKTRLQDEYNKVIRECDIFISLFSTKVGLYTAEEFNTAFSQFQASDKPFIYTYFKSTDVNLMNLNKNDLMSLWDFQEKLKALGHFPSNYTSIDELKFAFKNQLIKIIPKL